MEMATQTTVRLVDDITGQDADETITFGIDGKTYEIDLAAVNAQKFREAVERFVKAARVVTRRGSRKLASVPAVAAGKAPQRKRTGASAKREWLAANGWPRVANGRGRFSAEQDAAWERHQSATAVAQLTAERLASGKAPSVVEDAPADAPADAPQVEEAPTTRTRVTGMTGPQVQVMQRHLPTRVRESGQSWVLLAGTPEELVGLIGNVRAEGVPRGESLALSRVAAKLAEGDEKYVKVSDAA
jgi:hypothetical protein